MPSRPLLALGAVVGLPVAAGGVGVSDFSVSSRCCCSGGWSWGCTAWIWPAALWSSDCAVAGSPWRIAVFACSIVERATWAFWALSACWEKRTFVSPNIVSPGCAECTATVKPASAMAMAAAATANGIRRRARPFRRCRAS